MGKAKERDVRAIRAKTRGFILRDQTNALTGLLDRLCAVSEKARDEIDKAKSTLDDAIADAKSALDDELENAKGALDEMATEVEYSVSERIEELVKIRDAVKEDVLLEYRRSEVR